MAAAVSRKPARTLRIGREDPHLGVEAGEQDVERRHQDDDEQGVEELELVRGDRHGDERHPQVDVVAREGDPERVVVLVAEPEQYDQGENGEEPSQRLPLKPALLGRQLAAFRLLQGVEGLAQRRRPPRKGPSARPGIAKAMA